MSFLLSKTGSGSHSAESESQWESESERESSERESSMIENALKPMQSANARLNDFRYRREREREKWERNERESQRESSKARELLKTMRIRILNIITLMRHTDTSTPKYHLPHLLAPPTTTSSHEIRDESSDTGMGWWALLYLIQLSIFLNSGSNGYWIHPATQFWQVYEPMAAADTRCSSFSFRYSILEFCRHWCIQVALSGSLSLSQDTIV